MKTNRVTVDISLKSYSTALAVILAVIFFRDITGILLVVFISFLVTVAISPLVNILERNHVPRSLAAFLVLFLIFSGLITLAVSLVTPLVTQTVNFIQQLPPLVERLAPYDINLQSFITPQITAAPSSVFRLAASTFGGALAFFTTVVISFYMIQTRPHLKKHLASLFGPKRAEVYHHAVAELEVRLGHWVRGQIFLMVFVGLLNYLGFILIGLPSAIPLAVIAGVLELIPNIGPTVAAVPAVLVGFSISQTHGLLVLGLVILIQQLENNIIVPKVMQKAVGLHPIVTILVLSIGYKLGGILLAILALPLVLGIRVAYSHLHAPTKEDIKEEIKEDVLSL